MTLRKYYMVTILLVGLCVLNVARAEVHRSELPASTSFSDGPKVCLGCHQEEAITAVQRSSHGQARDSRTPFAQQGCESCHGAAGEHAGDPTAYQPAVVFGANAAASDQNQVCLGCHEGQNRDQWNWHVSDHARADVTCTSCHDPHSPNQKVLARDTQWTVCVTCHTDKRLGITQFSRHPIREGQVVCADCHNPHGGIGPSMLVRAT
ncbi:MAG: cytochrome c3 family protein, partial [Gammaproteobacteria bacterium]|nr:cytochrome c3 family protein [Gammaproteobacteria bacterium]